jgi:flagellar biosynthesis/type III secretory pathway M-ring protein FliF/YscJ
LATGSAPSCFSAACGRFALQAGPHALWSNREEAAPPAQGHPADMPSEASIVVVIKLLFAVLSVAALVAFVIRPLLRMIRTGPDADVLNPYAKLPPPGEEEEAELEIPTGGDREKPDRAEILDMARKDPREVATLIQRWLREKK